MITWQENPKGEGVIVALDEKIEWLLPWWWARYNTHNSYPVCFVDLGMSHFGKSFCKERGKVIFLEMEDFGSGNPQFAEEWEEIYGPTLWDARPSWLKKPLAMLSTPFEKTLWLDLDCEVISSLEPLFALEGNLYLAKHSDTYNSGVILYRHGLVLIEKWAEILQKEGENFWGDQAALAKVIEQENPEVNTLDENYNWRMAKGLNIHAIIIHWVGSWGKDYIRKHGGIGDELAKLPKI